jgi:peptidoglycan hydrolase FlgJ
VNIDTIRTAASAMEAKAGQNGEKVRLKEACRDFEAIFLKQMLSAMKKTVGKSELINGGMAEDIFEDMLYDEYAKIMSKTGSFGLADLMFRQLDGKVNEPNSPMGGKYDI